MKDQFGNEMTVHIVSGSVDPPVGPTFVFVVVRLVLVLVSKVSMRKIDIALSVYLKDRMVQDAGNKTEEKFGPKWKDMERAMLQLADEDRSVGKFFLREAMEAYGVKEKLNHGQIEEVMMGVYLVSGVSQL